MRLTSWLLLVCACEQAHPAPSIVEAPAVAPRYATDAGIVDAADDDEPRLPRLPTATERALVETSLRALQRALQRDDARGFAAIAHSEGLSFWSHRAEMIPPLVSYGRDGEGQRPSNAFAGSYFPRPYRKDVIAMLGRGLANIELEATDENDACDKRRARYRGAIAADVLPDTLFAQRILSMHIHTTVLYPTPLRFRTYGLVVYLGIEDGAARVTHVIVWDPCDEDIDLPMDSP